MAPDAGELISLNLSPAGDVHCSASIIVKGCLAIAAIVEFDATELTIASMGITVFRSFFGGRGGFVMKFRRD